MLFTDLVMMIIKLILKLVDESFEFRNQLCTLHMVEQHSYSCYQTRRIVWIIRKKQV